MLNFNFKFYS